MYLASTQCSVVELNCIGQVQVELRNPEENGTNLIGKSQEMTTQREGHWLRN